MNKYAVAAMVSVLMSAASAVHACSQLPAAVGFIAQNDKNRDAALSLKEWRQAQVYDYFVQFDLGNPKTFQAMDKNGDGTLTRSELSDKVRYDQPPCDRLYDELRSLPPASNPS